MLNSFRSFAFSVTLPLLFLILLGGCACPVFPNLQTRPAAAGQELLLPGEQARASALTAQLAELSPAVRLEEARRLATCAFVTARELRQQYSVVGPALFQNFLIKVGIKKRGLCYQWTADLTSHLDTLKVETLELRWGVAHKNGLWEHNCVVVTANGQPFAQGIVLDCWRNAGRLYFGRVAGDRYPWQEDHWDWRRYLAETNKP